MNKAYVNYMAKYFMPQDRVNILKDKIANEELHIFGSTGALGLSCLMFFKIFSIKPKKIIIYSREKSKINNWIDYACQNKIKIEIIKFKNNSFDIDLSKIESNSSILYFIGFAQPQKFMDDPYSLFEINVCLLSKITLKSPKFIFYTSTSEIYSGLSTPANECSATVSTPQHPRGAYIEGKRCGEAVLSHLSCAHTRSVSFRVALATPPYPLEQANRIRT